MTATGDHDSDSDNANVTVTHHAHAYGTQSGRSNNAHIMSARADLQRLVLTPPAVLGSPPQAARGGRLAARKDYKVNRGL